MKTSARKDRSSEVRRRIFEIIDSMPEKEVRNLHIALKKLGQSKKCKRQHPRIKTSIFALFKSDCLSFKEYVKNLSDSGLFIETNIPLFRSHEIYIQFLHPESKNVIKIKGKIVRSDSNGFGVKFDQPQPHLVLTQETHKKFRRWRTIF